MTTKAFKKWGRGTDYEESEKDLKGKGRKRPRRKATVERVTELSEKCVNVIFKKREIIQRSPLQTKEKVEERLKNTGDIFMQAG